MTRLLLAGAALLLLAGCGPYAQDPGYICTTNCAHECPDGIQGQSCRADQQKQSDDNDGNSN